MNLDLFLWPMILPFLLPLSYILIYSKTDFKYIFPLSITAIIIVIFYPILISLSWFGTYSYIIVKILLFIFLPFIIISYIEKWNLKTMLLSVGIQRRGLKKSLLLSLLVIPLMVGTTLFIFFIGSYANSGDSHLGLFSFFESFTEEVYFRGIVLLYLWKKTNLPIAYITSCASFILHHPQHFQSFFLIPTIVQAFLTAEIARRSKNIIGSWIVHGTNRFVSIALLPFIL